MRYNVSCSHQFRLQRKKMKEFQEANYARVRRRGSRRSSSEIARTKIQGKRHRVRPPSCPPLSRQVSAQKPSLLDVPLSHRGCSCAGRAQCALIQLLHKAQGAAPVAYRLQKVDSHLYLLCSLCVHSRTCLRGLGE